MKTQKPKLSYEQYIENKRIAEHRAAGEIEYVAVELFHTCGGICGGDNPDCRQVTRREWRKPRDTQMVLKKKKQKKQFVKHAVMDIESKDFIETK